MLCNIHEIFSPLTLTREKSSKANIPGVIWGSVILFSGGKIIDFPFCALFKLVISYIALDHSYRQFHWYDQRAVVSGRWQESAADGCRQAWQGQEQEPLTLSCERICKMELQPQELELAKR